MNKLPWYLCSSPAIFCFVAAVKFVEAALALVGSVAWTQRHAHSTDAQLLVSLKTLDAFTYALAWLGSAIIAKLLLIVLDRVSSPNA